MRAVFLPFMLFSMACAILCGCAAKQGAALPRGDERHEWRAAWVVDVLEEVKNAQSAKQLVEEARSLGLNTLFVTVFANGQAQFPSRFAPVASQPGGVSPLIFDPLEAILAEAQAPGKRRMKVFATVNLCQVWRSREALPPSHFALAHPDWITVHYNPNRPPDETPEFWLDPGVPAVQEFAANLCGEIVDKYPVDGLLVESLGYRPGGFGYAPAALRRFALETRRSDRPAPTDPEWLQWRARQVTALAGRAAFSARLRKSNLIIALEGLAEGPLTGAFTDTDPYRESGQDWPAWLREGLADALVLKTFKRQSNAAQAEEFQQWLTYAAVRSSGRALIAGLAARDNTQLATQTQIERVRAAGFQGVAFMDYKNNNSEGRPRKALYEFLRMIVFAKNANPPKLAWLEKPRTATLTGLVTAPDGTALPNLRIVFPDLGRETLTQADGRFYLFGATAGIPLRAQVFWNNQLTTVETAPAQPGAVVTVDFTLKR